MILTDGGNEFTDPISVEYYKWDEIRTRVFYCDPQFFNQKGSIEATYEFIRRILPEGTFSVI